MGYVEGFVAAVPAANKDAYKRHAAAAAPLIKEFGVVRMVEAWGDSVPDGKVTDFKGAVKAKDDEVVVFSWFEYPDKAARDAASARFRSDPRMHEIGASMPFDGHRMIYGGFATLVDQGTNGTTGYVDGLVVPVRGAEKDAYRAMAETAATVFRDHGATRVVEAWADDVPEGKVTDFKGAVKTTGDEVVVFAWIEWPSKAVRDRGTKQVMADPRMKHDPSALPFDGQRMIFGGFTPLLEA